MAATPSSITRARSKVAVRSRGGTSPNDPRLMEARRELATAQITEYTKRILASAPTLTHEQRLQIAGVILGGAA